MVRIESRFSPQNKKAKRERSNIMTSPYNTPDEFDEIIDDDEGFCQRGKSYHEMLQYLLSGEADDLSIEFGDNIPD